MTTMVSNLELLRRIPVFSRLTPSQAESIAEALEKRRFRRGEVLVQQHAHSDLLFILLTGRVRVTSTDKCGRQLVLCKLRGGDLLDEMSLIDNEPHTATMQAETHTDVLTLGRTDFLRCLQENTHVAHAVMVRLVQRLRQADRKIESFALLDVHGRVIRSLLEHAEQGPDGTMVIREKISRQDIAKMVGASREMVSRVMKDLEARGYTQTDASCQITLQGPFMQDFL
ncbi:Crp/Fnr family transcriptional regulator [Curvibacter lanceolatus]|uniref:Crp/Fnr family transcriptional regulator n=1 Tax=Curvibacter lanceolatus TaxID=86182 RepID=UPI0003A4E7B2|nr:Crp/Fnr family transcriptional regulator [Curvibacter lanceolatus]